MTLLATAAVTLATLTVAQLAGAGPAAAATGAIVTDSGCGTHVLERNDDGSTGQVALPFKLNFYNRVYTSLYVNNNGNVTFAEPMSTYTPFTIDANTPPIIAPFFADVDTRPTLSHQTTYGVTTYAGHPAFCVNWLRVGYYDEHVDKTNSFQLLLVQTSSQGDFDIVFNYGSIGWETGDASQGSGGTGGVSAGAGFSNGDGDPTHFVQLPGSLVPGSFLDSGGSTALASHSNTSPGVPGRYVYHIASGTQIAPAQACTHYYFISLVGSGQNAAAGPKASLETWYVYNALVQTYPAAAADMTFYQVPYQALGLDVLGRDLTVTNFQHQLFGVNLPEYLGSVQDGEAKLAGYMTKIRFQCFPQHIDPKFFLVGYSQGALIIHKYLLDTASDPTLPPQVGFVGLVADPAAVKGRTELINWGSASVNDYGICHDAQNLIRRDYCATGGQDIPAAFHAHTESVCNTLDAVCSTSTITAGLASGWYGKFQTAKATHSAYRTTGVALLVKMGKSIGAINHLS